MRFATANGIVLHHRVDEPDGTIEIAPTLVFSNSLGTDYRIWDRLAGLIGPRFRLVRYDKRGHGLSDAPPGPYKLDDHIADLAALLDHLGIGPAIVVGLSVGGMIAQGLSAARPDLVKALVLCNTAHKIATPEIWNERIAAVREGGIAAISEATLERWFSRAFHTERAQELAGWRHMLTRTPAEGYLATSAAIRDTDLTAAAQAISVPTLCVGGSEDGSTPPDLVRSLAALIPGAGFEVIEGAGHLPCIEKPDALASLTTGFFDKASLI